MLGLDGVTGEGQYHLSGVHLLHARDRVLGQGKLSDHRPFLSLRVKIATQPVNFWFFLASNNFCF